MVEPPPPPPPPEAAPPPPPPEPGRCPQLRRAARRLPGVLPGVRTAPPRRLRRRTLRGGLAARLSDLALGGSRCAPARRPRLRRGRRAGRDRRREDEWARDVHPGRLHRSLHDEHRRVVTQPPTITINPPTTTLGTTTFSTTTFGTTTFGTTTTTAATSPGRRTRTASRSSSSRCRRATAAPRPRPRPTRRAPTGSPRSGS